MPKKVVTKKKPTVVVAEFKEVGVDMPWIPFKYMDGYGLGRGIGAPVHYTVRIRREPSNLTDNAE